VVVWLSSEWTFNMDEELRCVFVASGEIHAQQVRAFLEASGIQAAERGESLRNTHGLTLDGIGAVQILVADADVDRARSLLASAEAGAFRLPDDVEITSADGADVRNTRDHDA
jgi:putative signal transducing protein